MQEALTAADAGEGIRARVARLVSSIAFQRVIVGLILLNAVSLGLETNDDVMHLMSAPLEALDNVLLWLFTIELALRIYAFRGRFFRDPWSLFDLVVIGMAWIPGSGPLSILRAARILRVLRLVSVIPSLRHVVSAMLAALPGMGSIVLLMVLIFYVFAVMATKLFGDSMPDHFGSMGISLFTLFQLMTLDDWGATVRPTMEEHPYALLVFLPFTVLSTFVVLNLFIGVIVDSIRTLREERERDEIMAEEAAEEQERREIRLVLQEVRALRKEIAALRAPR